MALFDKKPDIPRSQLRKILGKSDVKIGSGKQLSERQKTLMEKRDFPKRFGESISKQEYGRTIYRLKNEKIAEKDYIEKIKLDKKIKFLQELEKKGDVPK